MDFNNIPHEMRIYPQWVVWRYEDTDSKKPTKVPYSAKTGHLASVTDPNTWAGFDECVNAMSSGWYAGIGFVLTENDPYSFIDLDDTKGDQTALDRQIKIFNEFNSYAERSPSGSGLHIIVKGAIPSGRRRSFIEVYSSLRYMTMTGDVYRNAPINDCNELLNVLWGQMGQGSVAVAHYAGLAEAKETDEQVYNRAVAAANGDKFAELYAGKWEGMYASQSEADFALVDIIAFYTQNRAQISRMFRASGLGQRDKAKRDDYVSYMLNKCFDRMLPPVDVDGLRNKLDEAIAKKEAADRAAALSQNSEATPHPKAPTPNLNEVSKVYSVPPGLVGEIAQYIYAQAPRPVPEIALAGALGLVAGIVGRAYNISGTGLNQYVLLLAPTGTGKEAIASGIDKLMAQVIRTVPAASDFIGPGEIASSQAIIKYMSRGPTSFVSLVGEFGIYLQQMASVNAPPHLTGLRRFLLDAYNKSGEGKVLRPSIYSDKDKNTAAVLAPSFTLLGESTPEKFYEGLHEGLISEGLLPRFTMIEYHGERPALNPGHLSAQPSFELIDRLSTLCAHALMLNSQHKAIHVQTDATARELFQQFDAHCDANINTSDREVRRHLWNRAHVKALKLAGIIAVGCNPYDPTITADVASWAINLVVADVRNLLARFDAGEIGIDNDETKQLAKVISTVKDFVVSPWPDVAKYAGEGMSNLHSNRIVPYSYVQRRLAAVAVFRKDRIGASGAIKRALKTLCERGDLQEVSRATLAKDYGTSAVAYMVAHPGVFGL
ncbi:putative DNA primase/helicase [Pseudomonas phage TehO]|uniref:DNA primase/helicase n=1 Tax=Pseudomonas phage TehO TaxID=2880994 RepID=A0ABY3P9N5_9CAUD|nr:putative DNA primase/helicase [Pseudomonas phage TehO]UDF60380.1 putative DNA primase/helicase [Pseudomonas phage TehO]UEP18799.1 DNA primase/helicase [Pseudomonas phage vB_Pae_W3]